MENSPPQNWHWVGFPENLGGWVSWESWRVSPVPEIRIPPSDHPIYKLHLLTRLLAHNRSTLCPRISWHFSSFLWVFCVKEECLIVVKRLLLVLHLSDHWEGSVAQSFKKRPHLKTAAVHFWLFWNSENHFSSVFSSHLFNIFWGIWSSSIKLFSRRYITSTNIPETNYFCLSNINLNKDSLKEEKVKTIFSFLFWSAIVIQSPIRAGCAIRGYQRFASTTEISCVERIIICPTDPTPLYSFNNWDLSQISIPMLERRENWKFVATK